MFARPGVDLQLTLTVDETVYGDGDDRACRPPVDDVLSVGRRLSRQRKVDGREIDFNARDRRDLRRSESLRTNFQADRAMGGRR